MAITSYSNMVNTEKLLSKTSAFLKLATSVTAKDVQLSLNSLYPNEKAIAIDGEVRAETIKRMRRFLRDNSLNFNNYQGSFFNQKLWKDIVEKANQVSGTFTQTSLSGNSAPTIQNRPRIDLASKFRQDILCNLSNIEEIKKIVETRIDQINAQNISEQEKTRLINETKNNLFESLEIVVQLKNDLDKNFGKPEKIREIGKKLISDIQSEKFPQDIKNKIIEEMTKIVKETMKKLIESRGMAAQLIEQDLKKSFPDITKDLFPSVTL